MIPYLCRYQLTSFQSGLVVSLSLFGALAGSAAAFVVGDPLGRKRELLLASGLYGAPLFALLALMIDNQIDEPPPISDTSIIIINKLSSSSTLSEMKFCEVGQGAELSKHALAMKIEGTLTCL